MIEVPDYPRKVTFEVSEKCNFKCIFCPHSIQTFSDKEMPLSKIKEMSDLVTNAEVVTLTANGEVILHSEFAELVDFMKEMEKPFIIVSNGYGFTDEIIKKIKDSTVCQVNVSLNAMNKETHAKLHGVSEKCFDRIIENIYKLSNGHNEKISRLYEIAKKRYKSAFDTHPSIKNLLTLSFVATCHNFRQIKSFIDLAKLCNSVCIIYDLSYRLEFLYEPSLRVTDTEENRGYLKECKQYAEEQNVNLCLSGFGFDRRQDQEKPIHKNISKCRTPWEELIIGINGAAGTCCFIEGASWENINDKSWAEIWNGQTFNELRQCILNNDNRFCKNCLIYQ